MTPPIQPPAFYTPNNQSNADYINSIYTIMLIIMNRHLDSGVVEDGDSTVGDYSKN